MILKVGYYEIETDCYELKQTVMPIKCFVQASQQPQRKKTSSGNVKGKVIKCTIKKITKED